MMFWYVKINGKSTSLDIEDDYLSHVLAGSGELDMEPILNDTTVRFWCPELTQEGQWRHVVLIFHKAGIMKNSSVSLFVDGQHVNTQKVKLTNLLVCLVHSS